MDDTSIDAVVLVLVENKPWVWLGDNLLVKIVTKITIPV